MSGSMRSQVARCVDIVQYRRVIALEILYLLGKLRQQIASAAIPDEFEQLALETLRKPDRVSTPSLVDRRRDLSAGP
jgi:hypothetical protein